MADSEFETPTGKGSKDENFPVGSFLLPAHLRPHVAVFYAFARAGDDIADNPDLTPEEKVNRLTRFEEALAGQHLSDTTLVKAHLLRDRMKEIGLDVTHPTALLQAFKQDAIKSRYATWSEVMDYCEYSANPVGRFLLDLHGEDKALYPASDALCEALQVINHLQDVQKDFLTMDRVYLPQDWLKESQSSVEDLKAPAATSGIRNVIDRCIGETEKLLDISRTLAPAISSRRLGMETAAIQRLAEQLTARLKQQDPLAVRVELSKPASVLHIAIGAISHLFHGKRDASAALRAAENP